MADYGSGTMGTIDHILGSRDEVFKPGPTADQDRIGNLDYYFQIDENTNKIEVKRKGFTNINDVKVGTYDENGKFSCRGEISGGYHQAECEYFTSKEGSKATIKQAKIVAKKDLQENGSTRTRGEPISADEAAEEANEIIPTNTGKDENTGDATKAVQPDREGTRNDFGTYMYPKNLGETTQDIIKFDMMKWEKPTTNADKEKFGFERGGFREVRSIGSVILPIPGGIKDSNKTQWGGEDLDALQMAAFNLAKESITGGAKGAAGALDDINQDVKNAMKGGANGLTSTIATAFAGAAIGKDFKTLSGRFTGQIMNPNMELLFGGPSLRPFSFSFLLAPRSKEEAKQVVQIIRFFKQGMAPIRSQANLFLKSPHTFQLQYKHRGAEHPYLNKFKECALKSCSINYTPEQSYSTYEDGVMTAYSMTLEFQELEPVYNDDYGNEGKDLPIEIGY